MVASELRQSDVAQGCNGHLQFMVRVGVRVRVGVTWSGLESWVS